MTSRFRVIAVTLLMCFSPLTYDAQPRAVQSNCPAANPFDEEPDDEAINACLAQGGIVTLDYSGIGGQGYYIRNTLYLRVSGTVLTSSSSSLQDKPYLRAHPDLYGPMLRTEGASNYEISNLTFDGWHTFRNRRGECSVEYRDFGSNLVLDGSGFLIRDLRVGGAMCGTGLGIDGSDFEVVGNSVFFNGFPADLEHPGTMPWADGITLGNCVNGYVHHNYLQDNTDVDLVIGAGSNCRVEHNTIVHDAWYGFAGLMIAAFAGGHVSHAGGSYSSNIVHSNFQDKLAIGIMVGPHPWNHTEWVSDTGTVSDNHAAGAVINLAIEGIENGTVLNNIVSGARGTKGFNCSLSFDYTAWDWGNATIQNSPGPAWVYWHGGPCTWVGP